MHSQESETLQAHHDQWRGNAYFFGAMSFVLFVSCIVSGLWMFQAGVNIERNAAIGAGVARWVVDDKTGETRIKYGSRP